MKKWCAALAAALLLWSGWIPAPAEAAEKTAAQPGEHDGYLVRLSDPSLTAEGLEAVVPEMGLYKVSSLDALSRAVPLEDIDYVEPDGIITLMELPDDPDYSNQWELTALGWETTWGQGVDGSGVRIGIIDTGIYADHEDLDGTAVLAGHNYIDGSDDTTDNMGHGTFVAGIIAADTDNGVGIAGVADGVELVPLKCFSTNQGTVSSVVKAVYGGVDDYGCDVLNMSVGVAWDYSTLAEAVAYAESKGVIVVAAVGNDGDDTLYYPAAYDSVIGVGAVDGNCNAAEFTQKNGSVLVVTPGDPVYSLDEAGGYTGDKGTSYSCAYVTAIAALAKQLRPELTPAEFRTMLADSCTDLGDEGYDTTFGYGLPQIPALIRQCASLTLTDGKATFSGLWSDGWLVAAAYDGDGRLLSCVQLEDGDDRNSLLFVGENWELPEGTASVSLMNVDPESWVPLGQALFEQFPEEETTEEEPAEEEPAEEENTEDP